MNNENQWTQPTPLRENRSNLIDFPVNALPPILREMAFAISRTTLSDVSMAATSLLSSISYCFSGQFRIVGKKDHSEPLVINSLIVAKPSFKKSPVISAIKCPYIEFAHDWNELNKQDIFQSQAEHKLLLDKLDALEKKKDVTADEITKLQTEISNIVNTAYL